MNKLILLAAIVALPCYALPPESHHQTELLPAMEAVDEFRAEGCEGIDRKSISLVRRTVSDSGLVVDIYGRHTRITCTMPEIEAPGVVMVEFSWPPSLTRQNGDPLTCVKYQCVIGEHDTITPGPSVILAMLPGDYEIKYQAIDCNGLASGFIDPIAVKVTLAEG